MKKFLFLLSFLALGSWVMAQPYNIGISGVVTDDNGAPVENVEINISTDSVPIGPIYNNTVYTDANGAYSDNFSWELPYGFVTVTMINCPNMPYLYQYFIWQNGDANFVASFSYCDTGGGGCSADIDVDSVFGTTLVMLTAIPDGNPPFTYQWNTGQVGNPITVDPVGTYCVTITDSDGCLAQNCVVFPDPQNCWVGISPNPGGSLTAEAQGDDPYEFLWNTGETTQTIFPNSIGQFCVTMTDAAGCAAVDCYWNGQDSLCSVLILGQPLGGFLGYSLTAQATGASPFSFVWSTGESGASIIVYESGVYCVTVTDADGCESSACYFVQLATLSDLIQGYVYAADSNGQVNLIEGKVYLIQYDPNAGTLTAVDSTDFSSNPGTNGAYYTFGSVAQGDYLVKAFLTPGSPYYENYMPTYHFSHLFWNEADQITSPYPGPSFFDIALIPGNNPGGPGFIGGLVSDGANIWGGGEERGDGDPMPNVSILLLDEQESPVAHTLTHADGTFAFESLAWGTYKVVVEIPGLEQGTKWVTIGPDNPSVDISFSVEEEGVVLAVKEFDGEIISLAYPNPVKDQLSLYFFLESAARGYLRLSTPDGRTELVQAVDLPGGGQVLPVSLGSLPRGMYILQVTTDGWMVSHRIVKE